MLRPLGYIRPMLLNFTIIIVCATVMISDVNINRLMYKLKIQTVLFINYDLHYTLAYSLFILTSSDRAIVSSILFFCMFFTFIVITVQPLSDFSY